MTDKNQDNQRNHTRYMAKPDLRAFIPDFLLEFPIIDISEGGLGIHHLNWPEFSKKAYRLVIRNRGRDIGSIDVDVVHKNSKKAGGYFMNYSEEQVDIIDRIVKHHTENVPY